MPIPEISNDEHSRNLHLLNDRAVSDEEMKEVERQLKEFIARYHELLTDLVATVEQYRGAAGRIK
jgi:hypothetical protein